jgi:type VI secretion system ImpA family protein
MKINRDELLQPIDSANPSGAMIRYDDVYREIQTLRAGGSDSQTIEYKKIEESCINVLKNTSKDLHIAVILTEALANRYGISGLTEGIHLLIDLCEKFWTSIHPNNPNDPEARLSSFIWMNDKLSDVMLKMPITSSKIPGIPTYTLANLIDARQLELTLQKAGSRREAILNQALAENRPTLEMITKSMYSTPAVFYESVLNDIKLAEVAIERLEEFLDDKFQNDAISMKGFDTHLLQIEAYAEEVLDHKNTPHPPVDEEDVSESLENTSITPSVIEEAIHLSADQLYLLLGKIAERLEEIDPKSPAPKLLKKAIEWGNMSTTELFNDLARHDISISEITKLLA